MDLHPGIAAAVAVAAAAAVVVGIAGSRGYSS